MRGLIVTHALTGLETALGFPCRVIYQMAAGTSTGSIISAGIAVCISAEELSVQYFALGKTIFPVTWRRLHFSLKRNR